jgi:hypothetical protein
MILNLFDEGATAGGGAGQSGSAAGGQAATGGAAAAPSQTNQTAATQTTRRMKPGTRKPPAETAAQDAQRLETAAQTTQQEPAGQTTETGGEKTPAERKAQFEALMKGEYKQEFTDYFQTQFNARSAEYRNQRDQLTAQLDAQKPLLTALATAYGLDENDPAKILEAVNADTAIWRERAEAAGMTVEQYKQVEQLKATNRQLSEQAERVRGQEAANQQYQKWVQEAQALTGTYPQFDLRAELGNENFRRMLTAGFTMQNAYESIHHAELLQQAVTSAKAETEKNVTSNIQARGRRPGENGTTAQRGQTTAEDIHAMTRAQRREIAKKLIAGEDPF